ncbi:MAG TPA: MFS transporter [Thermoanaerobaculia bacterium]|nr:MFS transporter [Thermoanaerobaculia bacterium]
MDAREPLFTRRFAALWAFAFVTFFSAFQLLPAIPFHILDLGGTKAQAGWFLAAYTFASAFAAPIMGSFADHLGRKRMLVTASLLFIGFSIAYGVITNLPLLFLVGTIHGALWSAIMASSSALMSEYIPESRRTQGLSYYGLSGNLAIAIAPAVGLWVYHFGWQVLCLEMAILSAAMAVGAMLLQPVARASLGRSPALRELWDWRVTRVALTLTTIAIGYGGVTSYAAILAVERGIEPRSLYLSVFALTIILVRLLFSHLADRLPTTTIVYPSLAMVPIAFGILAVAKTRTHFALSAALFGMAFGAMWPAFISFILARTDPLRRARTFGSVVWAFDAGIGVGSLLIGSLGQRYGLGTAFAVGAATSCLAIPIFAASSKGLKTTP